jgi:hypothetical protein
VRGKCCCIFDVNDAAAVVLKLNWRIDRNLKKILYGMERKSQIFELLDNCICSISSFASFRPWLPSIKSYAAVFSLYSCTSFYLTCYE